MTPETSYRIIENKVAHEVIDGEAIVIHFDTGNYYSLGGSASQLWQWIAAGASRGEMLEALGPLTAEEVASIDAFIASLVQEGILEEDKKAKPGKPLEKYEGVFEPPTFSKYNDMQNLLLSDPIHEVDEMGWPNLERS